MSTRLQHRTSAKPESRTTSFTNVSHIIANRNQKSFIIIDPNLLWMIGIHIPNTRSQSSRAYLPEIGEIYLQLCEGERSVKCVKSKEIHRKPFIKTVFNFPLLVKCEFPSEFATDISKDTLSTLSPTVQKIILKKILARSKIRCKPSLLRWTRASCLTGSCPTMSAANSVHFGSQSKFIRTTRHTVNGNVYTKVSCKFRMTLLECLDYFICMSKKLLLFSNHQLLKKIGSMCRARIFFYSP